MLTANLNVKYGLFNGHKVRWSTLYIQMITSHQTLSLMLSWSIFHVTQGHLSYKRTLNLYHLCPFQEKLSADATTAQANTDTTETWMGNNNTQVPGYDDWGGSG